MYGTAVGYGATCTGQYGAAIGMNATSNMTGMISFPHIKLLCGMDLTANYTVPTGYLAVGLSNGAVMPTYVTAGNTITAGQAYLWLIFKITA